MGAFYTSAGKFRGRSPLYRKKELPHQSYSREENHHSLNKAMSEEKLDRIEAALEQLDKDVQTLQTELQQSQKWQDRTWDVVKWVGGISAGLAVSASIALFGLVFRFSVSLP